MAPHRLPTSICTTHDEHPARATTATTRINRSSRATPTSVVVKFSEVYAPYKTLFINLIKADAVADCNDVSAEFADNIPFSGQPYKIESWSLDQLVLVKNDNYFGSDAGKVDKIVMVPKADTDTEIASLVSGETDFIFPQGYAGITEALSDPNIKTTPGYGTNYEGLYFQQGVECTPDETRSCAFKDADFRHASPSRSTAT